MLYIPSPKSCYVPIAWETVVMEIMTNILRLFNITLFFYVMFFYILFILFNDFHKLCVNNLTTLFATLQNSKNNKTLLYKGKGKGINLI